MKGYQAISAHRLESSSERTNARKNIPGSRHLSGRGVRSNKHYESQVFESCHVSWDRPDRHRHFESFSEHRLLRCQPRAVGISFKLTQEPCRANQFLTLVRINTLEFIRLC
jgi:hypothetical protein